MVGCLCFEPRGFQVRTAAHAKCFAPLKEPSLASGASSGCPAQGEFPVQRHVVQGKKAGLSAASRAG